jgi:nitrous oxide reductase
MSTDELSGQSRPTISRRKLVKAAAGVGVAAAVGAAGIAYAEPASAAGRSPSGEASPSASQPDGPVIVHLSDLNRGAIEVFSADSHKRITDHDLAARIARAATR